MAKIKQLREWTDSDMCLNVCKYDVSIHFPHATLFDDDLLTYEYTEFFPENH